MRKGRNTKTSTFGSSRREGHDSTYFYSGRLYRDAPDAGDVPEPEVEIGDQNLDRIFDSSSEDMHLLPDNSIHLMVTSPPYNVRKDYDKDLTLDEHLDLLSRVFRETYRVLVPGGRACVNVANVGRKPYFPMSSFISVLMIEIGYLMRGEIIWDKAASVGASTAWGSWTSATNPTLRDVHEYILVFSKGSYRRESRGKASTISRDEFLEYTRSIWSFPTASAQQVGHPAPFPLELPYRLIQLYSFENDIVLDPFMGSGTTAMAALNSRRRYVGYEVVPEYLQIAQERIESYREPRGT
ncbi:MAG TPA: site-specific DNA-methyltransferase [Anaerolineales bacterium]|nr:site-specific DNA-methyltransferase [Anaerolineales bacterium]